MEDRTEWWLEMRFLVEIHRLNFFCAHEKYLLSLCLQ